MYRIFLYFILFIGPIATVSAQNSDEDYRALWQRGAYVEARDALEERLLSMTYYPFAMRRDYAELLFATGEVDDAIALLESLAMRMADPATVVRLAEWYRYRGRVEDFTGVLEVAERQLEMLAEVRQDRDDLIATGRVMDLMGKDPQAVLRHYAGVSDMFPDYAPVYVVAGDLALRKRAYDVAARQFGRALDVDAENQDALAGLAWCYFRSADPRIGETLDRLIAVNPNHPRVRLLEAERLLDRGEADAALTVLDSVLAINSNHLDALAMRAAGFFLKDNHTAMRGSQLQALSFNPRFSGAYRIPGRVASRHYRFAEGRDFQRNALTVDAQDHEARLLLAFDLLRLGDDAGARGELERVFAADPYSVRAYNLLEAADAIDGFRTVERGIFRLQLPEPEATVLTDDALDLLNDAAERYQKIYEIELKTPVVVQVFDDHDVFMVRSVGLPGNAGHLGICFGQLVTMDSPRARPPGSMNWRQVLWHEFVHVITLQKTKNRMPRWLSEGISVYEETAYDPAWGQKLDPDFEKIVDEYGLPGVVDLERLFTEPESPEQLMFGYFASGEFVTFFVDAYGKPALVAALAKIGEGTAALDALVSASGASVDEMTDYYQAYMSVRCAPLGQLREGSRFRTVLAEGDRAAEAGDVTDAEWAYLRAFDLFPDYAYDDAPLRRLVKLYEAYPDTAAYRAALKRLVMWDPTAHTASVQLGHLLFDARDAAGAAEMMDRAFGVRPFFPPVLKGRAEMRALSGNLKGAVADWRRLVALDTPDRNLHRLGLARALAAQGDRVGAKAELLTLLESLPHFWDAQRLLLNLSEGTP